jgi:hypothetical protein
LGNETDFCQACAAGGTHRFGHCFIAGRAVGAQLHVNVGILGDGFTEAVFEAVTVNRICRQKNAVFGIDADLQRQRFFGDGALEARGRSTGT